MANKSPGLWVASNPVLELKLKLPTGPNPGTNRVRVADDAIKRVADTQRFRRADVTFSPLMGLAPDDSPLVLLVRGAYDIPAFDLQIR